MNICEHLSVTARLFPNKEAVVFDQQRMTFGELDGLSQAAARVLLTADVQRGDRVAMMLPNVPAFIVWYYAALRLGAIAVSISTRSAPTEVAFVATDCHAKVVIGLGESAKAINDHLPDCVSNLVVTDEMGQMSDGVRLDPTSSEPLDCVETDPEDPALILYTSGTTGFPKGATLSHLNVRSNVCAFNHLCNMQSTDRILLAVPLFHCFGQNALLNSAFNVGATLVLQRKFDPHESRQLIVEEKVSQLYGVPMMFQVFHDYCEPADLASINYCFSAAATLPIQTSQRWQEKFGMPIYEGYGLTETSPFASYNHRNNFIPGSIGSPIDCVEMKIVDTDTGDECPSGELGEIAIRGPNVMLGYWNRPDDTASAIVDGWFHSGDIGRRDKNGYFYIVDRVKDMITIAGLKVYPAEVERVLLDHPAVAQAAVVGFPDDVFGEKVIAFVVLNQENNATIPLSRASQPAPAAESANGSMDHQVARQIQQHSKNHLANYKIPRQVVLIEELPRNPSGKILKTKLRELDVNMVLDHFDAQPDDPDESPNPERTTRQPTLRGELERSHTASRPGIATHFVQQLVKTITDSVDTPDAETRLLDAGLDSLMIVEMSSQIQAEVGTKKEIPATLVFDYPRICDLSDFLVQELAPAEATTSTSPRAESTSTEKAVANAVQASRLEDEIANLTEEQALEALMKELDA